MVTREELVDEIRRAPEECLDEVYSLIKKYEQNGQHSAPEINVMAKLREIKISASPDLSIKANLHDLDTENGE